VHCHQLGFELHSGVPGVSMAVADAEEEGSATGAPTWPRPTPHTQAHLDSLAGRHQGCASQAQTPTTEFNAKITALLRQISIKMRRLSTLSPEDNKWLKAMVEHSSPPALSRIGHVRGKALVICSTTLMVAVWRDRPALIDLMTDCGQKKHV
jgi:hypothetical protein